MIQLSVRAIRLASSFDNATCVIIYFFPFLMKLPLFRFRLSTIDAMAVMDYNVQFLLKRPCDQCLDAFVNYRLFGQIVDKSCYSNVTSI